jgi:RecB family exonuclease
VLEARLLDELAAVVARRPEELEPPLRIIVPSQSLRRHLAARLMQWRGRALAGVVVQTLYAAALEICERTGEPINIKDAPYEIAIRRLADQERALRTGLGHLEDGYAAVAATVRDLFDAGFEPWHAEPMIEQLTDLARGPVPTQVIERATALVRVAELTAETAAGMAVARTSDLLREAAERFAAAPEQALPARRFFFYGYADATGTVLDLIETIVRVTRALVLVDQPPDPIAPFEIDSGASFARPLIERLAGVAVQENVPVAAGKHSFAALAAPTREAEVREAAGRIRDLLATGTVAETIAVVARDLNRYAGLVRRHFDRLGIPFSAVGGQVRSGQERARAMALVELLRTGERTAVDLWLAAAPGDSDSGCTLAGSLDEIRLGLRALGAARLADVAELGIDAGGQDLRLPVVEGWRDDGRRLQYRHLSAERLADTVARARRCLDLLATWPDPAAAGEHLEQTRQVLASLGWCLDAARDGAIESALATAGADLPGAWQISRREWGQTLNRAFQRVGMVRLGGAGGGVQVLSVMEARACTFAHLFVLGLNRDVFPRVVREDPLLPDSVRGRMAVVLPDIPVKVRGWSEERFLFAQLLASAANVYLSWYRSEAGQPVAPSPFVERLRLAGRLVVSQSHGLWSLPGTSDETPIKPAFEHATCAGLAGDREAWAAAMQVAVDEGRSRCGLAPADSAAVAARRLLLDEVDPPRRRNDLSPFAGCLGADAAVSTSTLEVTRLEQIARCPWQTFVTRMLGLVPAPDPLLDLPGTDPRLVGIVVHDVLQEIVEDAIGRSSADLLSAMLRLPLPVPWPAASHLEAMLTKQANQVASREGLARAGVAAMLVEVARPYLEVARQCEWQGGGRPVEAVGAEVTGRYQVGAYGLSFRADRVDSSGTGPCLVDYKTGKSLAGSSKREDRRRQRYLQLIRQGQMLQAVVYALAAGGRGASGRYLYLRPDDELDDQALRQLVINGDDSEVMEAFDQAVAVLIAAVESGCYFPRVEEAGTQREAGWCRSCVVRETCLRNDSAFRRRLVAWMEEQRPGSEDSETEPATVEAAAAALWWLGSDHHD